jgi:hypothetical protein
MTPPAHTPTVTRERGDDGQYVETVAPESVLDVFGAVEGPVITSSDVAEHLECTTEAARQKLQRLVDDGTLARRKTGRTVIYWGDDDNTTEGTPADTEAAAGIPDVGGLTFDRELTDARREVLEAFLRWVKTRDGGVTRADAETEFWEATHAETTGYGFGSFWEAFGKAALKQLEGVDKPNTRTYRWVGEGA